MSSYTIQKASRFALLTPLLLFLFASSATAQDNIQWSNVNGGDFENGLNWTDEVAPGPADSALFNLPGEEFQVDFAGNVFNNRLLVYNGDVTFDLGGAVYQLTNTLTGHTGATAFVVGVSDGNDGSLTVLDGIVEARQIKVGLVGGSTGTLTVGAGGLVRTVAIGSDNAHDFLAGNNSSTGVVIVEDGGSIVTGSRNFFGRNQGTTGLGGDGTLIVRGAGSSFSAGGEFNVATSSSVTGLISVEDGGSLSFSTTSRDVSVSTGTDSVGTIVVTGSGSTFTAGRDTFLGNTGGSGEAYLRVLNGGVFTTRDLFVRPSGTVSGNGTVTVTRDFELNGTISPGNSIGTLTVNGGLAASASAMFEFELAGVLAGQYDVLHTTGAVALGGGGLDITLIDDFELGFYQMFHVLSAGGGLTGTLTNLSEGALVGTFNGVNLYITYDPEGMFSTDNGGFALYSIPEPRAAASVLGAAVVGLLCLRRMRNRTEKSAA